MYPQQFFVIFYHFFHTLFGVFFVQDFSRIRSKALENLDENPTIVLNRMLVVDKLIELYSNPKFCTTFPKFVFEGEFADDEDGPKREVYNLFWDEIFKSNFEGCGSVVPVLGPDRSDDFITILGRVALHGYICCGFFPTKISKVFVKVVMFGSGAVGERGLLDGFLEFVTDHERQFLQNCMEKVTFTEEEEIELLDIVSQFGVRSLPNPQNIRKQVINMGKCELVNKPLWACSAFQQGMADNKIAECLWRDSTDIDQFYDSLAVTPQRVTEIMSVDDKENLTKSQNTVYGFFCRYIKACDDKKIRVLYRFLTGADVLAVKKLKVIFHLQVGNIPHITAHTCSGVVDLPAGGYVSYHDFETQFDAMLNNPESWKFHVA